MRGGTANCCVVVSDKPIGSPVVRQPGNAVVFNNPSFQKYEPVIAPDGVFVVNSSLVTLTSNRLDLRVLEIPATDIADDIGDLKLANVVLLGALLSARPILSLDALREALEGHIPAHHRDKLPLNFRALEQGAQAAAEYLCRVPEGDGR
jgi:2-oxoglutarate ferredoxin oxidoreductase subunit gamma